MSLCSLNHQRTVAQKLHYENFNRAGQSLETVWFRLHLHTCQWQFQSQNWYTRRLFITVQFYHFAHSACSLGTGFVYSDYKEPLVRPVWFVNSSHPGWIQTIFTVPSIVSNGFASIHPHILCLFAVFEFVKVLKMVSTSSLVLHLTHIPTSTECTFSICCVHSIKYMKWKYAGPLSFWNTHLL